jgi:hypothetical protein
VHRRDRGVAAKRRGVGREEAGGERGRRGRCVRVEEMARRVQREGVQLGVVPVEVRGVGGRLEPRVQVHNVGRHAAIRVRGDGRQGGDEEEEEEERLLHGEHDGEQFGHGRRSGGSGARESVLDARFK